MKLKKSKKLSLRSTIVYCLLVIGIFSCNHAPKDVKKADSFPAIYPDYIGVTIPAQLAPLNFSMADDAVSRIDVTIRGKLGGELHTCGSYADFDINDWHALTTQNQGSQLTVTVIAEKDGRWTQYRDFTIHVSPYPIDEWGLTYRRIAPGYEVYSHMGLYQRDLATFREEPILENTQAPGMCINCHTACQTDPVRGFVFHVRGDHGATMFQLDDQRHWLKAKNDQVGGSMVYPYWHPTGRYCAFSTNQTRQGFHVSKDWIEVFDLSSDVFVYNPMTHETLTDSLLQTKDWSENAPTFSPDGHWLYYMTCRQQDYPMHYKDEKYDLCRIAFDPTNGTFGNSVDTLFRATAMGKSLTWPRPSYDGRYILFTLQDYGYFSIWHDESQQWLLDLNTLEARELKELNSPRADSYHNWNRNSHWVVFTSRRDDGLYSRLYLASVDDRGHWSKPLLLPQRDPRRHYLNSLYSYNTPDFTLTPVTFDAYSAGQEILSDKRE